MYIFFFFGIVLLYYIVINCELFIQLHIWNEINPVHFSIYLVIQNIVYFDRNTIFF